MYTKINNKTHLDIDVSSFIETVFACSSDHLNNLPENLYISSCIFCCNIIIDKINKQYRAKRNLNGIPEKKNRYHARIQKDLSEGVFCFLVDKGREDPNNTISGP